MERCKVGGGSGEPVEPVSSNVNKRKSIGNVVTGRRADGETNPGEEEARERKMLSRAKGAHVLARVERLAYNVQSKYEQTKK